MQDHPMALLAALWAALVAGTAACLAGQAPAQPAVRTAPLVTRPSVQTQPLDAQVAQHIAANEWPKVERAIEAAWAREPVAARAAALSILQTASITNRIVGLGLLARNDTPAELGALAWTLRGINWADERRILVRAVGTRAAYLSAAEPKGTPLATTYLQDGYVAAKRFLDDEDLEVQAAAIYSLADLGMGKAVEEFLSRIALVPAVEIKPTVGTQLVVQMAMNGAAYRLSGVRAVTPGDIAQWYRQTGGATPTTTKYELVGTRNAQPIVRTADFDVYYQFGSERQPPKDGSLSPAAMVDMAGRAAIAAKAALAPIVGPVHLPVVRLFLCDKTSYGGKSSTPFLPSVMQDNEIIIRADTASTIPGLITHEYVHMIHMSMFVSQPRWFKEGLGRSIERSARTTTQRVMPAVGTDKRTMIDHGTFRELIAWTSPPSSDRMEPVRYDLAHLAIDFLRYGGFSAPNERLSVLMGKISRDVPHQRALEEVYGMPLAELDRAVARWVEQK